MALDALSLGNAIKTAFVANGAADNPATAALCAAIALAVVTHIQANALVAGTATGAMAGGPGVPVVGTVS